MLILLCGLLVLVAGVIGNPEFRGLLFSPSNFGTIDFSDDLDKGAPELLKSAEVSGEPAFTEYGLAVQPGKSFSVQFSGKTHPLELPYMRLWMMGGSASNARLTFKMGDQTETLALPGSYTGLVVKPQQITPSDTEENYQITFSSSLPASAQKPRLVLDRVETGHQIFATGTHNPGFWGVIVAALAPWALYELLILTWRPKKAMIACAIFTALICVVAAISLASHAALGFIAIAFIAGTALYLIHGNPSSELSRRYEWLLICGLSGFVLWIRWRWLTFMMLSPLPDDAKHYYSLAVNMVWPYDTEVREPFLMWPIWIMHTILAESEFAQRLATIALSIAEGIALFWLSREFLQLRYAWIPTLLLAFNPVLASNAVLGMREEAMPLGWIVCILGIVRAYKGEIGARPHIVIAIGAGIAILTRINAAAALVPVYIIAWIIKRWNFKYVVIAGAISAAFIFPHMIRHTIVYGDPFKSMNLYQVRTAEQKPGGTPVPSGNVIARMLANKQFLPLTARGTWNMIAGESARGSLLRLQAKPKVDDLYLPASLSPKSAALTQDRQFYETAIYLFALLGFIVISLLPAGWMIPTTILLFVVPISFVLELPNIREPRMLMNHVPLMLLLAATGFSFVISGIQRVASRAGFADKEEPVYGRTHKRPQSSKPPRKRKSAAVKPRTAGTNIQN